VIPWMKSRRRRIALVVFALGVAWFVPWSFVLHLGVLVYFPYRPDGRTRYVRVTGPVAARLGAEWTPRAEIPQAMVAAVIAAEDVRFHQHYGIDWEAVRLSMKANERAGQTRYGGSTITQQLVKNAFLSRTRSYLRKAREAAGALLLDRIMAKDTQLLWYLNVIEFGPDVYGIQRAARHYFRKSARDLTPAECIELAVIIPSPNRWNCSIVTGRCTLFFQKRYSSLCDGISVLGLLDRTELRTAHMAAPVVVERATVAENETPHESDRHRGKRRSHRGGHGLAQAVTAAVSDSTGTPSVEVPSDEILEPASGTELPPAAEALAPEYGG